MVLQEAYYKEQVGMVCGIPHETLSCSKNKKREFFVSWVLRKVQLWQCPSIRRVNLVFIHHGIHGTTNHKLVFGQNSDPLSPGPDHICATGTPQVIELHRGKTVRSVHTRSRGMFLLIRVGFFLRERPSMCFLPFPHHCQNKFKDWILSEVTWKLFV